MKLQAEFSRSVRKCRGTPIRSPRMAGWTTPLTRPPVQPPLPGRVAKRSPGSRFSPAQPASGGDRWLRHLQRSHDGPDRVSAFDPRRSDSRAGDCFRGPLVSATLKPSRRGDQLEAFLPSFGRFSIGRFSHCRVRRLHRWLYRVLDHRRRRRNQLRHHAAGRDHDLFNLQHRGAAHLAVASGVRPRGRSYDAAWRSNP